MRDEFADHPMLETMRTAMITKEPAPLWFAPGFFLEPSGVPDRWALLKDGVLWAVACGEVGVVLPSQSLLLHLTNDPLLAMEVLTGYARQAVESLWGTWMAL